MSVKKEEAHNLLKNFTNVCAKNQIWYAADLKMLLLLATNQEALSLTSKMQVMMTSQSYKKLVELMPNSTIDSAKDNNYKSLKPLYIFDNKQYDPKLTLAKIEIRIIVPTTVKKVRQFKNQIHYFWLFLKGKRDSLKIAINDLKSVENEGYYLISSRFGLGDKSWLKVFNFKNKYIKYKELKIAVPFETLQLLKSWYNRDPRKLNQQLML